MKFYILGCFSYVGNKRRIITYVSPKYRYHLSLLVTQAYQGCHIRFLIRMKIDEDR